MKISRREFVSNSMLAAAGTAVAGMSWDLASQSVNFQILDGLNSVPEVCPEILP
jgi:hypothetical protein